MKNITKKIIQLFTLIVLFAFTANAEVYEKEGVIVKEYEIGNNTKIDFTVKNSDVQVKIWGKQTVKLECFYKLKARNKEDIDLTLEALENPQVRNSGNVIEIQTSIFSNVRSYMFTGLFKKIVATLTNGPTVNLSHYEMNYILTLPDNHDLLFKQKYSDLNMADYAGNTELDLHDVDLRAGDLPKLTWLKAKYSSLIFGNLGNCDMDLHDSDLEAERLGDFSLVSKYSKFEVDAAGTVVIDSHDDKLFIYKLKSIEGKAKYTDLEIGDIEFGDLYLHDCELKAKDCGELKLEGKYSGIVLNDVSIFKFPNSHDNKVEANFVGEFTSNSKYTEFEFGRVAGMIDFETYDDKLIVDQVDEDFYLINVNGKYTDVDLNFLGTPQYFIEVDFKYTKYDIPKDVLYSEIDTKSSKFKASGRTEGLRSSDKVNVQQGENGIRKANIGKMSFVQHDGHLTIKY